MKFTCSVCALPFADRAAVENELSNGAAFRDLAAKCGLSKSSLHRHWTTCVNRRRLAELKQRREPKGESRVVVVWPSGECNVGTASVDFSTVTDNDWILNVVHEAGVVRNPGGLVNAALAEDEQRHFPQVDDEAGGGTSH